MQRQPLQRDDRAGDAQAPLSQPGERGRKRYGLRFDVLAMFGEAEQPAGAAGIDPGDERVAELAAGARARVVAADRHQVLELEPGLLRGLAARDIGWCLAGLDDAGDRLEQPGLARSFEGADPELLDQHHLLAHRIVRQDDCRIAAVVQLAHQHPARPAGEQPVAQAKAEELEEPLEDDGPLLDFDAGVAHFGHRGRASGAPAQLR